MTYIYKQLTAANTVDEFRNMNRLRTADNEAGFTAEAVRALHDWYEQKANEQDSPIELDVIALCSNWTQYDSCLQAWLSDYRQPGDEEELAEMMPQDREEAARAYFDDQTTVIDLQFDGVLIEDI